MESVARSRDEVRRLAADLQDGRDEMNLVEFPFALLSERAPKGTQVLEFEDEIFDREKKQSVRRRLSVTGDPQHGLPTAKDEEVYLGLLQLTKLTNEFTSPVVRFTRLQLIELLGWKNEGWSYERITKALQRLAGVRLYFHKSWRDNARREWRDRGGFGMIDSFQIRDSRNADSAGEGRGDGFSERFSEFRWNSVLFESFEAGYLKKLDYGFVRDLPPIAKRLYRFLDKHFYAPHRLRLEFDLRVLACEHLGLSRKYDAGQIRRYLQPAVAELERAGFITKLSKDERYKRLGRGLWQVVFVKKEPKKQAGTEPQSAGARELVEALTSRGVAQKTARRLVEDPAHSETQVAEKVEAFDWYRKQGMPKGPGFLVESIRQDYSRPEGFEPQAERQKRERERTEQERKRRAEAEERDKAEAEQREAERERAAAYLQSLSEAERNRIEGEALADVDQRFLRHMTETGREELVRHHVHEHVKRLLAKAESGGA